MAKPVYTTAGQQVVVCDTPTVSRVPASTSSTLVLSANNDRLHAQIFNESTAVMYLKWGDSGASTTSYTTQIPPRGLYEVPRTSTYVGPLCAVWSAANGAAQVTEAT